jgi:type II secretory pathway component PulF
LMREFFYQALAQDQQLCTGQIAAPSAAAALESLESQGYSVLLIRQVDAATVAAPSTPRRALHNAGEKILTERVAEMLEKRAVLAPALAAFAEEMPSGRARRELSELASKIHGGATAEELSHASNFTSTWLPLIGNQSTVGAAHLQDVLAEAERETASRTQMKRILAYPVAIVALAFLVFILLAIMVVPAFEDIFNDFDMLLPDTTVMVVSFSRLLRFHPVQSVILLLVIGAIVYVGLKVLREWILPGRALGVFLNGNSQQVTEMAAFVRRLAEALNARMPLPDALELVGRDSRHRWLRREALQLAAQLAHDPGDGQCLRRSSLPATVAYALQAGPEGAPHVQLLQTLAESYSERVHNRFNLATGFLPQFAIMAVGIAVGIVVLALFLPLVDLINGLTG